MDINVKNEEGEFKYRVVGILFDENERVLIQRVAENPFYCLPGGRVELGESSLEAVKRELEEELGFDVKVEKPLFFLENFFTRSSGKEVHEIGIFFRVTSEVAPKEDWEIVENDKGELKKLRYKCHISFRCAHHSGKREGCCGSICGCISDQRSAGHSDPHFGYRDVRFN